MSTPKKSDNNILVIILVIVVLVIIYRAWKKKKLATEDPTLGTDGMAMPLPIGGSAIEVAPDKEGKYPDGNKIVGVGSRGREVREVQRGFNRILKEKGRPLLAVDENFGPKTAAAAKEFVGKEKVTYNEVKAAVKKWFKKAGKTDPYGVPRYGAPAKEQNGGGSSFNWFAPFS